MNDILEGDRRAAPATRRAQRGVSSIEYALLGSLIAVVIAGSVMSTGTTLGQVYDDVAQRVSAAVGGQGF